MSCASLFAVKHAVEAARAEIGKGSDYFTMSKCLFSYVVLNFVKIPLASPSVRRAVD